MLKYKGVNYMH